MSNLALVPGDQKWTVIIRVPDLIAEDYAGIEHGVMWVHERGEDAAEAAHFAVHQAAEIHNADGMTDVWEAGDFTVAMVFAGWLTPEVLQ